MRRDGLRMAAASAAVVLSLVAPGRGQQGPRPRRLVLQNVSAGAVDRGLLPDETPPAAGAAPPISAVDAGNPFGDRVGASGAAYEPGRIIVKFRDNTGAAARSAALSAVSASAAVAVRPSYANFDLVTLDPAEDAEAAARAFARRADVEYAQPAYRVYPQLVPNDPLYRVQWNLPSIDMERAWDIQPGATASVVVAVLDSGIAFQDSIIRYTARAFRVSSGGTSQVYPSLGTIDVPFAAATDLRGPGRFASPYDFIWDDDLPLDLDGHGTHVSGTIGQLTNNGLGTAGVAFNVRLMPVKVIDDAWDFIFGSPNEGTDQTVARGIRYAADNGAKVINMSIGRTGPAAPVVEDAVRYAVGKGAFIAIAAGNAFESGNPMQILAEIASRVDGAVSVGAVDQARNRAFYSSTGSWVELSAPGGSSRGFGQSGTIYQQTYDLSFVDTYTLPPAQFRAPRFDVLAFVPFQGTSMATPHVAGLAALLAQQGITSPAAIEAALERFAADRGAGGRDHEFGFGEISARNTLRGLGLSK